VIILSSYELATKGISTLSFTKTYSDSTIDLPTKAESISLAGGQIERLCLPSSMIGSM